MVNAGLPRLLYLGDVPVESSYYGSALLYRLLQNYPVDGLRIAEGNLYTSRPERRLPGVVYETLQVGVTRLLHTRLSRYQSVWLSLRGGALASKVPALLAGFEPEAVLTVAHGHLWVAAAEFARRRRLPLHLIVHDDWPRITALPQWYANRVDRQFAAVYRAAASRLCVSPFMRDFYRDQYGSEGEVLYPSRAADCPAFDRPPERVLGGNAPLTVAFAGTINSNGYARLLAGLADCLQQRNGRLLLFGPHSASNLSARNLDRPNVCSAGLLPSSDLIHRLRREADVLFVPMSFEGTGHHENMRVSFPSKLTDYTAVGLPLLICGPDYCSGVKWAHQHHPVADVVTSDSLDELGRALDRLASPPYRSMLASRALEVGKAMFAQPRAESVLFAALRVAACVSRSTT